MARGDGPDGTEIFELPLPAVVAVMEGGVSPRYPSIPGRMKAKRAPVETVTPDRRAARLRPGAAHAAAAPAEHGAGPRPRPGGRAGRRRPAGRDRGGVVMIVVLVETDAKGVVGVSQEALTFARELSTRSADAVQAVVDRRGHRRRCAAQLGEQGVAVVHHPDDERLHDYAAAAWAAAVVDVVESAGGRRPDGGRHAARHGGARARRDAPRRRDGRQRRAGQHRRTRSSSPGRSSAAPRWRRWAWPTGSRSSPWPGTPAIRSRPRPRPRPRSSRSRRRSPTATSSPGWCGSRPPRATTPAR